MRLYNNTKLFYNAYPYKLVCSNDLANEFREKRLYWVRDALDQLQHQWDSGEELVYGHSFSRRKRNISKTSFFDAKILYNELKNRKSYTLRVQYKKLCIYSTKKDWLLYLSKKIVQVEEFWEPDVLAFLEPGHVYLEKDIGYEYRITLKNTLDEGQANWLIANQNNTVRVGTKFLSHINNGEYFVDGYYLYVKSEKAITLAQMILNSNIRRIDKVVYKDKNA